MRATLKILSHIGCAMVAVVKLELKHEQRPLNEVL